MRSTPAPPRRVLASVAAALLVAAGATLVAAQTAPPPQETPPAQTPRPEEVAPPAPPTPPGAIAPAAPPASDESRTGAFGQVMAADEFEYSFSTETGKEIVENWLDLSWTLGGLRAGILLDHQAPSEDRPGPAGDGIRTNLIRHRFAEFSTEGVDLRAGHFFGLFGRGLLFASYEDRRIRVDTALDGVIASGRRGRLRGTVFSGTPDKLTVDVRGLDSEVDLGRGWSFGASGLTYRADTLVTAAGRVHREWVAAPRLQTTLPFGGLYVEYGWKKGWDYQPIPDDAFQGGHAFYGALDLARGPWGLSFESKDYLRFAILPHNRVPATGPSPLWTQLNNPPSLTREHLYTLLNRAPHVVDADDERGQQAELTWSSPAGWAALLNASRTERHDGTLTFEEVYAQLDRERWGDFRLRGALGYRDSEGLRQVAIGEVTWFIDEERSLTFEDEHQHVRLRGRPGVSLGAYDEDYLKLELGLAPAWALAGILEMNNKYAGQRAFGEKPGPFPAVEIAYATSRGTALALWAGKRQAGYLCAGGVCKYEPAFEGVELTGTVRY